MNPSFITLKDDNQPILILSGRWLLGNLSSIKKEFEGLKAKLPRTGVIFLDCKDIEEMDTASMLFFISMRKSLKSGLKVSAKGLNPSFLRLFKVMSLCYVEADFKPRHPRLVSRLLYHIGENTAQAVGDFRSFLDFTGRSTLAFLKDLAHPSGIRLNELAVNIQNIGVMAVPIIALSAFLIGVVIAFQSAVQLKNYGANIFIVDMVGISIPRELSPLITAIVVAGRSASAFTAQIGAMKVTEELDAMETLGFDTYRFIILPRILATIITLPLLIFFADIVGIYAGMLVSSLQLDIRPAQFLERLEEAVSIRHYLIGLLKGPFFALAIASIGCFRGLQVSRNTQSIGRYTTVSVVNSIFAVIFLDAVFSIIFTELKL
ncbi:ABC transporter permease [Dissulfurimicrobium hydrothermale]|uniref:ABC transporter permease n=1 Tax=Dissulfurimicrobium hydrothermale TaxID=1750598 RepID=UPI001EDB37AC|nr:MlaE family lipid ABC transporter permease subunit [Dissulfurimicrobium hydrothermale]UKL14537.1 MlaE family lipid ABC transporter permease subunit [Dissulfurimicrobium hydrothermale]